MNTRFSFRPWLIVPRISALLVLLVLSLAAPSSLFAEGNGSPPDSFRVTHLEDGASFDFVRQPDGSYRWFGSEGGQGAMDLTAFDRLESMNLSMANGWISVEVESISSTGGTSNVSFDGSILPEGGSARGTFSMSSADPIAMQIDVDLDGGGGLSGGLGGILAASAGTAIGCVAVVASSVCPSDCVYGGPPYWMMDVDLGVCGHFTCVCSVLG